MPHGFGRVLDASGECYIGEYRDTLRHGHGVFVTADGKVFEGEWVNDEFNDKKNTPGGLTEPVAQKRM